MIRVLADNVLLLLEPSVPERTAGGIFAVTLQPKGKEPYGHRIGRVLAVGPGHYRQRRGGTLSDGRSPRVYETGEFVPTTIRPGQRAIVDMTAGDAYTFTEEQGMAEAFGLEGDKNEVRMVREEEILAVIEAEEGVAAE